MKDDDGPWGFIDTSGQFAITPRFDNYPNGYVYPFADGLAMIEKAGRFGYISHSGEIQIPPQFLDGIGFSDGMARVVIEGPCVYFPEGGCGSMNPRWIGGQKGNPGTPCKFTYIDKKGQIITGRRFVGARDFSEGLAPVQERDQWGFINKQGAMAISPRFEDAWSFASGLTLIRAGKLYGFANREGHIQIAPSYVYAESFSEGLSVVSTDGKHYFYIDKEGKKAIKETFDLASPFFKGLAHVHLNNRKEAYIDTKGRRVFTF